VQCTAIIFAALHKRSIAPEVATSSVRDPGLESNPAEYYVSSLLSFHMTQSLNRNNTGNHRKTRNQLQLQIRVNENTMAK